MGSLTQQQLMADEVITDRLTLAGTATETLIKSIDANSDPNGILLYSAVKAQLQELEDLSSAIRPDSTFYNQLTVLSQSITKPYFTRPSDWELTGWTIQANTLRYVEDGSGENSISISNELYPAVGHYYVLIYVNSLPSGKIEMYQNDEWIGTIEKVGSYYKEFTLLSTDSDKITLKALDVSNGEVLEIASFGVYYVASRFYEYVLNKVKELATVDATGFVTVETFNKTLEVFIEQFKGATDQYLEQLTGHLNASNPHKITPELIAAAPEEHTHPQYITQDNLGSTMDEKLKQYALKNHTHDEYTTFDDVKSIVDENVSGRIRELITVDPMIIAEAPDGLLPSRFAQTDVSLPLTILLPTTIKHNTETSYDWQYGIITTNHTELMTEAPKVFGDDTYAVIPSSIDFAASPVNFRICYHSPRKITGYRIHSKMVQPQEWAVYSGNTTFLHRVSDPENYVITADDNECEIFFDETVETDSLSFIFNKLDSTVTSVENWELRIELYYDDYEETAFGITPDAFSFCVPQAGANRVVSVPEALMPRVIKPEIIVPEAPLYIYGRKNNEDVEVFFDLSYIPPEYGTVCRGLDIFVERQDQFVRTDSNGTEEYTHPAFGALSIIQGNSATGMSLLELYKNGDTSWRSDGQSDRITIEQTFDSDNIALKGYQLNWKNADVDTIPDTWTLTVTGVNEDGNTIVTIFDSVEQYYPFYSVEDDDIVYHAKFDIPMTVKKITLVMGTSRKANPTISLNQLGLFVCERYYSIPQNTMSLGLHETSAMCLGKAIYHEGTGWEVENLCNGRSCVIPVNNLATTLGLFTTYTVPNPFMTDDVSASIHSYEVMPSDTTGRYPSASITSITADTITISSENGFQYAVAISRNW